MQWLACCERGSCASHMLCRGGKTTDVAACWGGAMAAMLHRPHAWLGHCGTPAPLGLSMLRLGLTPATLPPAACGCSPVVQGGPGQLGPEHDPLAQGVGWRAASEQPASSQHNSLTLLLHVRIGVYSRCKGGTCAALSVTTGPAAPGTPAAAPAAAVVAAAAAHRHPLVCARSVG